MTNTQVLAQIRETNLSYLELARKMIVADRSGASAQLGIAEAAADMLVAMSPLQMAKVSSGNTLLCSADLADDMVWGLLTGHRRCSAQEEASALVPLSSHDVANLGLAERLFGRKRQAA